MCELIEEYISVIYDTYLSPYTLLYLVKNSSLRKVYYDYVNNSSNYVFILRLIFSIFKD